MNIKFMKDKFMKTKKLLCLGVAIVLTCANLSLLPVAANELEDRILQDEMLEEISADLAGSAIYAEGAREADADGFVIEDGVLVRYTGTAADVIVPEGVTSIGIGAFNECDSLVSITFPKGMANVGGSAFWECSNLLSVTFAEGMESVDNYAFYGCSSLESLAFPYGLKSIGDKAFYGCSSLLSVVIPESVTNVGCGSFACCYSLDDFNISEKNKIFSVYEGCLYNKDKSVFVACPAGKTEVIFSEAVMRIRDSAFEGCINLAEVRLPEKIEVIEDDAFYGCGKLLSIAIPKEVTDIWSGAFANCGSLKEIIVSEENEKYSSYNGCLYDRSKTTLVACPAAKTEVTFPEELTSIGARAFEGCSALASIELPKEVTDIGHRAFLDCSALVSIVIPEGVEVIESNTFEGCKNLASIALPKGLVTIESGAFQDCNSLFSITIPEKVKVIEGGTFFRCLSLTTITLPENLAEIGEGAFEYCSSLAAITLPKNLSKIGEDAFWDCSALISVEIPEGIEAIERSAFAGCTNLVSILFPKSIDRIGYHAFAECSSLVSIELPGRIRNIEGFAFSDCNKLTSIRIPESVISIEEYVFNGCNNLTIYGKAASYAYSYAKEHNIPFLDDSDEGGFVIEDGVLVDYIGIAADVKIPEGVMKIGKYAFDRCDRLIHIVIPDSVTDIGYAAFYGCSNLTGITMGKSVTSIGEGAFYSCGSLSSLVIPESVTKIGASAFFGCSSLTSLTIPKSVIYIEGFIAARCDSLERIKVAEGNPKYDSRDNCNAVIETETNEIVIGCKNTSISPSVTGIGYAAFCYCEDLTSMVIPKNITSIGEDAFYWCINLKDVVIPDSVTSIGKGAFEWCLGLTSITIPDSVTSIHETAFDECSKDLVIYGRNGSVAETYAKEHGIHFKQMPDVQPEKKDISACQIKLAPGAYTYDGKPKTPSVTVKDGSHTLAPGKDYTVEYQGNRNAGTAKAVVTGAGSYTGSITKTFSIQKAQQIISCTKVFEKAYGSKPFTLNAKRKSGDGKLSYTTTDKKIISVTKGGKVAIKDTGVATITVKAAVTTNYAAKSIKVTIKVLPAKQAINSMKLLKGRKIAISWKKDTRATGYQIQWSTDKKFKKGVQSATVKKNKTPSKTLSKLAKGKRYYIRVRSYKSIKANGKPQVLNGAWTNAKRSGKVKG